MMVLWRRSLLVLLVLGASVHVSRAAPATLDAEQVTELGILGLTEAAAQGDAGAALVLGRKLADRTRPEGDHLLAVKLLEQAASAGITEARTRLGDIFRTGLSGVPADPQRAVTYLEAAAASGDNLARRTLAGMLLAGIGTARDPARAVTLLETAAAAGLVDARNTLAGLYARGEQVAADGSKAQSLYAAGLVDNNRVSINGMAALLRAGAPGVAADTVRALALYELNVASGDRDAVLASADMILHGEGTAADIEAGVRRLEGLAASDPSAYLTLGDYFLRDARVPPDAERAAAYYTRAADLKVVAGMIRLGDLFRTGASGLEKDAARAFHWYDAAASLGDKLAARRVADMLARGEGVARDVAKATAGLEALGDAASLVALGDIYARPELGVQDTPRAAGYYEKAAALGNVAALVRLGDLYRFGAGALDADGNRASGYLVRAIEAGDNSARRAMAALLFDGRLVARDASRAVALLEAAIGAGDAQAGIDLGNAYASGAAGAVDYDRAVAAFDNATRNGSTVASFRKGLALLRGPLAEAHGAEGKALLEQAVAAGVTGAALELAKLRVAEGVDAAGARAVVAMLEAAAPHADAATIRYLLQIYRDGLGSELPPARRQAAKLLESSTAVLGAEATQLERIQLEAYGPATVETHAAIAVQFDGLPPTSAVAALRRLAAVNENAYVYVLQVGMGKAGHYRGALNGTLTTATIGAVNDVCAEAKAQQACEAGPLSRPAVEALSAYLFGATPTPSQ